jgi:NAD(P)-dependent dehydrogenase (short-subunit alcohol dehydrogenase family)
MLPPMAEPIPIIGGTGALGFGLALRWARAGRAVVIGSRSEERAGEAARKLSEAVPDAEAEGLANADAARQAKVVFLTVPFRAQSENLTNLKEAWSTAPSPSRPPSAAGRLARSASGRGRPPSRRRRWSPTGSSSSPPCTR